MLGIHQDGGAGVSLRMRKKIDRKMVEVVVF